MAFNCPFWRILLLATLVFLFSCSETTDPIQYLSRYETIPPDAVKMTPETDLFPPVSLSSEWEDPVPLPGPVNTAGAEDAAVISWDGSRFLFFFTPDVDVLPENQLLDGATGIWESTISGRTWSEPTRVILNNDLALDGPMALQADTLWFASFRVGNYGEDGDIWTAILENGIWGNWQNAGQQLNATYNIGEVYLNAAGSFMVFHGTLPDGYGGYDLWSSSRTAVGWNQPQNLGPLVNSAYDEGWPWLSPDGNELWFNTWSQSGYQGPSLYRTLKTGDVWSEPQEIIANFAGDAAVDQAGNVYFTHHFFDADMNMIEADIYVSYRIR